MRFIARRRVAAAAEGDEVLVSEETARALADVYRFDEERHIDAKGLNDPIAVRRLIWAD